MSTQNLQLMRGQGFEPAFHRIGSVSRLAGVPVSTLRMWEGRYAAFTPGKSEGRHRLYAEEDVVRARLLRQLTEAGHSISGIARLGAQDLQDMLVQARTNNTRGRDPAAARRLSLVVVGGALAARITSQKWQHLLAGDVLDVRRIFRTPDEALLGQGAPCDVLLVRVSALQPGAEVQLRQLMQHLQARHAVVLYSFGAHSVLSDLREAGMLLRREPIQDDELAQLLSSMTWAGTPQTADPQAQRAAIPARRYSDEALTALASRPPHILCECPRHIADIIMQLASFEEYSARCLNQSEEDARVHAYLRSVSGSARALFEDALDRVMAHESGTGGEAQPAG